MITTAWAAKQVMKGNPKPGRAALKRALYGAVDGTVTLAASCIPLLIIGHYLGTIEFNLDKDWIVLKLLGASVLVGALYGAPIGVTIGVISSPCISLYMDF